MKKLSIIIGFASFILAASQAMAGVVITQTLTHPDANGADKTTTQTIMIDGGRQKTVQDDITTLVDLDKGVMIMLDAKNKTATEMPLNGMGRMMQGMSSNLEQNYKATGGHKTVAGYACDEYSSSGKITMMATTRFTAVSCFSASAPGAAEYGTFAKKMMDKLGIQAVGRNFPAGVVLAQDMTTQPPDMSGMMKGMPPEVAKQMAAMQAQQKSQTTRSVVTSIKTQSIPADSFAVPAGYKRKSMNDMMQGGMPPNSK